MQVKTIENIDSLLAIKDNWNSLFKNVGISIFQSFDYCYHSARINNSKLFVITMQDKGELVEIWPCQIINKRLRFINDSHADFCDILSITSSHGIVNFISSKSKLKGVYFKNLRKESLTLTKFKYSDNTILNQKIDFSVITLKQTDNFPSNFERFVYRQKRRLKRVLNKYTAIHKIDTISKSPFPLNEIINLRTEMIRIGSRDESFMNDELLKLCVKLYQKNKLIISSVNVNEEIAGISLIFKNKNEYSFWIDLYNDKQMMNLFHNTLFIKHITLNESAIFNFGRGTYRYKLQNFSPDIFRLYELTTFSNSFLKMKFFIQDKCLTLVKLIYKEVKK